MTQANETNSRIARLEALMLEIAAANLRHERNFDQNNRAIDRIDAALEQGAIQHNAAIARIDAILEQSAARQDAAIARHDAAAARHDAAIARHDEEFNRISANLEQLEQNTRRHDQVLSRIDAQQELNAQAIAQLTAGLIDLRNLVANYIQGRSEL